MNSRLKRFFGIIIFGSALFCAFPKAEPLLVNEQVNNDGEESIFEAIYDKIAYGDANIVVSVDNKSGIRPNIDVEDPPKTDIIDNRNIQLQENSIGNKIANFANNLVGKPYAFGSTGPNSFDCSGFVFYVYKSFNINLPRTSQAQAYVGQRVNKDDLRPGDLVFSNTYSSLSHVGIYLGNGKFVHSANYGTGVTISDINGGYYGSRYAWSTRPY